jgi:hypothetical protein
MSFRLEKKIKIHKSKLNHFHKWIIDNDINKLYPSRKIKSLYYDNLYYQMFRDSIEGVLPRKKIRIRFYPDDPNKIFSLEKKISSNEGRYKKSLLLSKKQYGVKIFDKVYGYCQPLIEITYFRDYYTFKGLRITLDQNISVNKFGIFSKKVFLDDVCLEIKAPHKFPQDILEQLIHWEEIRFSKYCKGIDAVGISSIY